MNQKRIQKPKRIISFLCIFLFTNLWGFCQNTETTNQELMFKQIKSLQIYLLNNIDLLCGNEENLSFNIDTIFCSNSNNVSPGEESLICSDKMIIYKPYGDYIPGSFYTDTKIELLNNEENIYSLQIQTVGNRYEYFECTEIYYFIYRNNKWERTTY